MVVSSFLSKAATLLALLATSFIPEALAADSYEKSTNIPVNPVSIAQRLTLQADEKAWLANSPTVRIRVGPTPPLHSWEDGEAKGISVDYMRTICKGFGLDCLFFTGLPWSEAIENIGTGRDGDLILTIKRTPEREPLINFTQDYLHLPWVIFTRTDSAFVSDIENLIGKTVSVENGFVMQGLLEKHYPGIQLHIATTTKGAIEALATGQVDAYVGDLTVGTYMISRWGLSNVKVAAPTPFGYHTQAMGVRKDWPELVSLINKFHTAMTPQEHSAIQSGWLSIKYEHGIDWAFVWKLIGTIVCIATIIFVVILLWNRRLQREIELRKQLESALRHGEARLAAAQHLAHIGSWELDLINNRLSWSDEVFHIFGVTPQEFEATYEAFLGFVHPDDKTTVEQAVNEALEKGTPYNIEHRAIRADGSERVVREIGEVQYDAMKKPIRMIGTVHDITQQRQLEQQLHHSSKMEALGTLIGGVAHDFNNKLGAITGNTYLAKKEASGLPELTDKLKTIESLSFEMSEMVKQLITFTKGDLIQKETMDLNACLKEAVEGYSLPDDISFHADLPESELTIKGASQQIQQVILRVLDNAVDAVAETPHPLIQISSEAIEVTQAFRNKHTALKGTRFAHLEIKDNGSGIASENMEHIFDPFFTTKDKIRGQGLGLSITYGLIQHHNGTIDIDSSIGLGTLVHIYLPLVEEE